MDGVGEPLPPGSDAFAFSRKDLENAEISHGLKALAKELDITVSKLKAPLKDRARLKTRN